MLKKRGQKELLKEYGQIRTLNTGGTFNNSLVPENRSKNRYTDILCLDHTRVLLSRGENEELSDYINANYVDGYLRKNAYICTQAPLTKTCNDFWRMIWEQRCHLIVMTTRISEHGQTKCVQYWPLGKYPLKYDHFEIRNVSVEKSKDFNTTMLDLTNTKINETRKVCHMQFIGWPDHGVPKTAKSLLHFLHKVREKENEMLSSLGKSWTGNKNGPPTVVHCSAGIGRTGTFITLDICIAKFDREGTLDVKGIVEKLRTQRAHAVQMPAQYVFCYQAMLEHAVSRGMLRKTDLKNFQSEKVNDDSD